jgi:hypothetical protein
MRRSTLVPLVLLTVVLAVPDHAHAQTFTVSFQAADAENEYPPGTVLEVHTASVPTPGATCEVLLEMNNESPHAGNDLLVSSGGQSLTFEDVEDDLGVQTFGPLGPITLGNEIVFSVRIGEDETYSIDAMFTFDCETTPQPEPPPVEPPTSVAVTPSFTG